MLKPIATQQLVTIGLDLGDKHSKACVINGGGEFIKSIDLPTTAAAMEEAFSSYPQAMVVLEVGTHSPWVSRLLEEQGFQVVVANPRKVRLIAQNDLKTDSFDAELLARLGRFDLKLLSPIRHRGEQAQQDLALIRARDGLVRTRTQLITQMRGLSKAFGQRIPNCSTEAFVKRARQMKAEEFFLGAGELLETIEQLTPEIHCFDRQIEQLCQTRYPETARLRQVKGVGALTALCFVLTLEDPLRFPSSRSVGAYLGLRPRLRDSGERHSQLNITKAGDKLLRKLLVSAAHYILGPFGPDTHLRRFGLRLSKRGGKAAKKRAVVAVARKLATLLHHLWLTGETYEALLGEATAETAA